MEHEVTQNASRGCNPMTSCKSALVIILLLASLVLVGTVGATDLIATPILQKEPITLTEKTPESMKVIAATNVTEDQEKKATEDYGKKEHAIKSVKIPSAIVKQNYAKKLSVNVEATPRSSGGITVELFCQDNTGRFIPIWGGSITKTVSDWEFTENDIRRANIDGCYFAVVDTTAEMGVL